MFSVTFPLGDIKVTNIEATYNIEEYMQFFKRLAALRKTKYQFKQAKLSGVKLPCRLRCCKSNKSLVKLKNQVYQE